MRIGLVISALVFSTVTARADPAADVGKLVDAELAWLSKSNGQPRDPDTIMAPGAEFDVGTNTVDLDHQLMLMIGPSGDSIQKFAEKDRQIVLARDGKTAWISFTFRAAVGQGRRTFNEDYRVTELAANTPKGWRIIGGMWSTPAPNAKVNADAKAGKLEVRPLSSTGGDQTLRDAIAKLAAGPLDADAAVRADLVAFGSGPGERTVGGKSLAKAWTASWAKHLTVGESFAALAPSGTTGWAIATMSLEKGAGKTAYKIPFQICFVFDKTPGGAWSVVHAHISVP